MRKLAEVAKALAHPTRLLILEELTRQEQCCVSRIEEILQKKQANVSQHLGILKNAGFIDYIEKGKLRCYFLKNKNAVSEIIMQMKKIQND